MAKHMSKRVIQIFIMIIAWIGLGHLTVLAWAGSYFRGLMAAVLLSSALGLTVWQSRRKYGPQES